MMKMVHPIFYDGYSIVFHSFERYVLTSEAGSLFLWSSFILHGTQPQKCDTPRISLRYDIKPNSEIKDKNILIKKFLANIKGNLSMPVVRDDIDFNSKNHKQVKFNKILK